MIAARPARAAPTPMPAWAPVLSTLGGGRVGVGVEGGVGLVVEEGEGLVVEGRVSVREDLDAVDDEGVGVEEVEV